VADLRPHTLFGVTKFVSWPVIVEGEDGGERGTSAPRQVSRLLHRLVCLLALGWDEPWQERCTPIGSQGMPPQVADSWPPGLQYTETRIPAGSGADMSMWQ
jgi:hypothetical protein